MTLSSNFRHFIHLVLRSVQKHALREYFIFSENRQTFWSDIRPVRISVVSRYFRQDDIKRRYHKHAETTKITLYIFSSFFGNIDALEKKCGKWRKSRSKCKILRVKSKCQGLIQVKLCKKLVYWIQMCEIKCTNLNLSPVIPGHFSFSWLIFNRSSLKSKS